MKYNITINLEFPDNINSEDLYGSTSIEEWIDFIKPVLEDEINRMTPLYDYNKDIVTNIEYEKII